jgi:hypothetical protein
MSDQLQVHSALNQGCETSQKHYLRSEEKLRCLIHQPNPTEWRQKRLRTHTLRGLDISQGYSAHVRQIELLVIHGLCALKLLLTLGVPVDLHQTSAVQAESHTSVVCTSTQRAEAADACSRQGWT